jgi:hypothetical protein
MREEEENGKEADGKLGAKKNKRREQVDNILAHVVHDDDEYCYNTSSQLLCLLMT